MRKLTILFALLCASMMSWADPTPYCGVTSPNENFTFSLMNVSGNLYRIQFDAIGDVKFGSTPYNVNCGVNQSAGAGIFFGGDNAANWVMTDDRAYYDFTTASEASVPTNFYGNYFCFNKKGGGLIEISGFNPADVDWSATCGTSCDDSQKPVVSAVAVGEITYNSAILTITASDNVAVTRYVVKNGDVQLAQGTSNVITLANLAPATSYDNIKVYAYDACNNESDVFNVASFTTDSRSYCRFATGHLSNPTFGDIYGRILLTIKKVNETTIAVRVEPNNNGTKGIKYLNIIVDGVNHEYGNNDGSGDDLTGFFEISGLTDLDFTFNLYFYCNTPNWTTNQFNVTESELCTEEPMILTEGSEYCGDYGVECDRHNGAYAYLKWETTEDGDVVISMVDGVGSTNARFRGNNGMGENLDGFTVLSGSEFGTSEAASKYFTRVYAVNGNTFTLQRKGGVVLPSPAKIRFASPALEWSCTQDGDGYAWPTYVYTYGKTCPVMSGYAVSASVNNNTMGSAVVKQADVEVTSVEENTEVTFIATSADPALYRFVNWTKGGVEVSTSATYVATITETTNLVANFDYIRETYCHTAVQTSGNKKVYLTVGKGATDGTYQIKIEGSEELTITGINNANTAINHVKYLTYDGNDVPLNIANEGWTFSATGYGVITSAEIRPQTGHTWREMWMWRPDLFMGTSAGEQVINSILDDYLNWDNECSDTEAPVFGKAEAEVLNETSVQLKIQATDNWGGLLTYTIARAGASDIILNGASGEELTQEVTGLTTNTEYDFTITVSDGVNDAVTHIVVTPIADNEKPVMTSASLDSKTWNSAIINVVATDNKGVTAYYIVELAAEYVAAEGKITVTGLTAATAYTFTIKAKDAAGNISDDEHSAEVSFTTDAHLSAPATAAPVPTLPANQVKSLYSNTYDFAPASLSSYNECWWECPNMSEGNIDGNTYLLYDLYRNGMIGVQFAETSMSLMEKIHIDIWASAAGTLSFRPITTGGPNTPKTLTLAAQQWNTFDIDLTEYAGHDWSKVFQYSIEFYQAGGLVGEYIAVDNVFFYRTTPPPADEAAPTDVVASKVEESFASAKISAQANDDSGVVHFKVMNGTNELVSDVETISGAAVTITVNGLTPNTNYTLSVVAFDEAGHEAEPVNVAVTTRALPSAAPHPTHDAAAVLSVYSDAYTPAVAATFNRTNWGSAPIAIENDYLLYTMSSNVIVWGNNDGNAGHGNIDGLSGYTHDATPGLDVSGMTYIHFDVWCDVADQLNTVNINDVAVAIPTTRTIAGQWVSFDVDITGVALADRQNVRWMKFHPFTNCNAAIDNVYFWKNPDMVRDADHGDSWMAPGELGTVCIPQGAVATGGDLYTLEGKNSDGKIVFATVPNNRMTPGVPYLFQATSNAMKFFYTDEDVAGTPDNSGAMKSTFKDNVVLTGDQLNGVYYFNGHALWSAAALTELPVVQYRAYVKMDEVSEIGGGASGAPGRRYIIMDVHGQNATTDVDLLNASEAPVKMIIDGKMYILRGEKMYDATGRLVK